MKKVFYKWKPGDKALCIAESKRREPHFNQVKPGDVATVRKIYGDDGHFNLVEAIGNFSTERFVPACSLAKILMGFCR